MRCLLQVIKLLFRWCDDYQEIDELTASKEKLAENFRKVDDTMILIILQSLLKLQQDEISIDKYKKLVEEQDKDMKNQQEVMFTTIHKVSCLIVV